MTLENLIKTCLRKGIYVQDVTLDNNDNFCYCIGGFSKSDKAKLYMDGDVIKCETRYKQIDTIETFEDLAWVAYGWNKDYINSGYGWSYMWIPIFIEFGWLEKKEETITRYTAKC